VKKILEFGFERDFERYIDLLGEAIHDKSLHLTVLVAVKDTPCGSPKFNAALAGKLCHALGTKTLLHDKFRYSYAAIIDNGVVKYESGSFNKVIDYSCRMHGHDFRVTSVNFNLKDLLYYQSFYPTLEFDGVNRVIDKKRGIHFVVFDKHYNIVSRVRFDAYIHDIPCETKEYYGFNYALKDYTARFPHIKFLSVFVPQFPLSDLSDNEIFIREIDNSGIASLQNPEHPMYQKILFDNFPDVDAALEVSVAKRSYETDDGLLRYYDCAGKYYNIIDGHRVTMFQPEHPKRKIYFFGCCHFIGYYARDEYTIESVLQKLLNINAEDEGFCVENYGYSFFDRQGNTDYKKFFRTIESITPAPGDIFVFMNNDFHFIYDIAVDCRFLGNRPHEHGEIFVDSGHFNENGYRLIAEKIFETLKEHDFLRDYPRDTDIPREIVKREHIALSYPPEDRELLKQYKQVLSDFYDSLIPQYGENFRMGGIVMNCNPFTLGHRHLIETAAAKVDFLLVFVVSEDKSIFPFADRFKLVDLGTSDLPNVGVIESGKFIISAKTFSGYFNKASLQNVIVDSSEDVTIFAQEIAPAAHISIRFVGTEPFDKVTNQYNRTLSRILPEYGIEFEEIPRRESGGDAISASRVRKLLEEQKFDEIATLVPPTTLEYLKTFAS
jgi:[citrate (pro-3S)-lyase] ligase